MGNDKTKQRWDGGHMWIELIDDLKHFVAGCEIKGVVHLELK